MPDRVLVAHLPSLQVLSVSGPDRDSWLQGQITNDVYRGGTIHAFRLDATGKIEAELRGFDDGTTTFLVVDSARAESLVKSLDRRIVMEDVAIARLPDRSIVAAYRDGDPIDPALVDGPALSSRRFGWLGCEWIVGTDSVESSLRALEAGLNASRSDEASLDALRIELGAPRLGVDFDACLPQETGLARSTVSFTKGCYVGQEPVVMLEHRGKPPRRMLVVTSESALEAPFDLVRDGVVVGRCHSFRNGRGLALVKRANAVVGTKLGALDGEIELVSEVDVEPAQRPTST